MVNKDLSTEQIILKAAEEEFLEKGFGNTKMMAIARRANISHSMLHYYFRNKENLFQKIFIEKLQEIAPSIEEMMEEQMPFKEIMRRMIGKHFDFVAQNPKLPHFLVSEILTNNENRRLLYEVLESKVSIVLKKIRIMLHKEYKKGTIRKISLQDLVTNIVSLNVASFIIMPLIQELAPDSSQEMVQRKLARRRESNIEFILNGLLIDNKNNQCQ